MRRRTALAWATAWTSAFAGPGRRWVILPPGQLPDVLGPTPTPISQPPSSPLETESPTLVAAQSSAFPSATPRPTAWLQQPVYATLDDLARDFNVSAVPTLNASVAVLPAAADAAGLLPNTSIIVVSGGNVTARPLDTTGATNVTLSYSVLLPNDVAPGNLSLPGLTSCAADAVAVSSSTCFSVAPTLLANGTLVLAWSTVNATAAIIVANASATMSAGLWARVRVAIIQPAGLSSPLAQLWLDDRAIATIMPPLAVIAAPAPLVTPRFGRSRAAAGVVTAHQPASRHRRRQSIGPGLPSLALAFNASPSPSSEAALRLSDFALSLVF